jgi:nitrate/nitrite transporter NarK
VLSGRLLWFPSNELGLALGIAGIAPSFGTFLSLTIVGNLTTWGDGELAWMLRMLFAFLSFLLWRAVRDPPIRRNTSTAYNTFSNRKASKHVRRL